MKIKKEENTGYRHYSHWVWPPCVWNVIYWIYFLFTELLHKSSINIRLNNRDSTAVANIPGLHVLVLVWCFLSLWSDSVAYLANSVLCAGEFINLAMYCERIRRKFWPGWFVDVDDLYSDGSSEEPRSSLSPLLDLGLFSHSDGFAEEPSSLSRSSTTHSLDSDRTGHSLYDSDMDGEYSEADQVKC